ncbi:MAG: pyridoxal phosphate-dependent aminotransferase [Clostridia bacterium]|nr:pyridoxal phosphate-dependent aminotransferase [Clostridia bacterium]
MLNEKNVNLGKVRSSIRELFEYGKERKAEIGEDKVFDFSLGNPSVPVPDEVTEILTGLLKDCDPVALHGYTSAPGDYNVRKAIADYTNSQHRTHLTAECFYMTCGASASLTAILNALLNEGEEVITFVPCFPEYKVFCEHAGGKLIAVDTREDDFQIDFEKFERALNKNTKAVLINSPNNPSGVVYSEQSIKKLSKILLDFSKKRGSPVYLISDEPYRELVYDDSIKVPYVMNYYDKSIVCYSYSKSLSLPGERIGYVAVNNAMEEWQDVFAGVCGAGRALGFVCAPNLFQQLVARACGKTSDISIYKRNRDRLCSALQSFGFTVVKPDGAFYLFVKSPEPDANAFAERAKKYELLIVSGDDFGRKGYVRICYCVAPDMIERSLPAFKALADSYK